MSPAPRPVSFLLSPTTALNWYPPASRVLTSALRGRPDLDVTFSTAPVDIYFDGLRRHRRAYRARHAAGTLESYMRSPMWVAPHLDVVAGLHDERILASVPAPHVLVSALSVFDLFVVARLLAAGKQVLLGGNLTLLYSRGELRDLLAALGADPARLARDLIVLRGYLTPQTDLGALLDAWRDAEVAETDHRGLLTARDDLLLPYARAIGLVTHGAAQVAVPLSSGCWYGRCEFCTARNQPTHDFVAALRPEEVAGHLHELAALYHTDGVVLTDNYMGFSAKEEAILARRAPVRVTVYSGVRLLCDPEYVKRANRCADGLRVGVESGSDFALAQIRKGFRFADTERAAQNLIDHFDRDKELNFLIVYDLPHESAADVRRGFARLCDLTARLRAAGFRRVVVSGFPLLGFPGTDVLTTSPLLEPRPPAELPDEELSGAWILQRWYEQAHGVRLPATLDAIMTPFRRRGRDGAVLPSDLRLLDQATVDFLEDRPAAAADAAAAPR
ncbi:MAG TPA: hypothetical protein VGQ83_25530 [Polyangia bacterium]|jgi:hypothetical protein